MILITHEHFDHFDPESIEHVRKQNTVFVAPAGMREQVRKAAGESEIRLLQPGEQLEMDGVTVRGVPAYNRIKPFHRKRSGWLGYLVTMDGLTYYIAGDTDAVKEAKEVCCDIALVPVGGTYTMDAKEAAELVNAIRPRAAVPTHYGSVVGKPQDGERFAELVRPEIRVVRKLFS